MRLCQKFVLPALPLLAATALAGCGGGSSTTSAGSSSANGGATTTTTVTRTATPETSGSTSSSSSAGTAGVTACRTPELRLSRVSGQGAAGTAYLTYGLTNAGSTACTMIGYPGVAVLDGAGHIVQHPARRGASGPTVPLRLITLAPGARATFLINSTDVIPSPGCSHSFTGTTIQVFPPNQRVALRQPFTGPFCNLRVGPVKRG